MGYGLVNLTSPEAGPRGDTQRTVLARFLGQFPEIISWTYAISIPFQRFFLDDSVFLFHIWMFPKIGGFPLEISPCFIGFSIIYKPSILGEGTPSSEFFARWRGAFGRALTEAWTSMEDWFVEVEMNL